MGLAMAVALHWCTLTDGGQPPRTDWLGLVAGVTKRVGSAGLRPKAQSPGLRARTWRAVNKVKRMPKHTKLILGLCAGGMVLFFVAVWAKTRV